MISVKITAFGQKNPATAQSFLSTKDASRAASERPRGHSDSSRPPVRTSCALGPLPGGPIS